MATVYEYEACIRGYHVYQTIWIPVIGEMLVCAHETANRHDPYAVKVLRSTITVGHLPKKISSVCLLLIRRGGTISCRVTGNRRYSRDLAQGGLEIPCVLIITGDECLISKVMKLLLFSKTMAPSTGLPISGMSSSNDESGNEENPPKKMKVDPDAIDVEAWCPADH